MSLRAYRRANGGLQLIATVLPGVVAAGFHETCEYLFEVPAGALRMYVDDAPLPPTPEGRHWVWTPGFYAGRVHAEIVVGSSREPIGLILEVAPAESKAPTELVGEYLEAIAQHSVDLLMGVEPATWGLAGSAGHRNLWVAYRRLRLYGPAYLRAMRAIQETPIGGWLQLDHFIPWPIYGLIAAGKGGIDGDAIGFPSSALASRLRLSGSTEVARSPGTSLRCGF